MAADVGGLQPISYDWRLVVLSIVIGSFASYVALTLGERVTANRKRGRFLWLFGGALAMGGGIWSMHFTGMLALRMPIAVGYDVGLVVISLVAAIVASAVALYVVSGAMTARSWLLGGILMGGGVTAMHYIGMAAMSMPAKTHWNQWVVAVSVVIAVVVSLAALFLVFQLRADSHVAAEWRRVAAALVMGIAIAGMHYTGMAAATFTLTASAPFDSGRDIVSVAQLGAGTIALVTVVGLGFAIVMARLDRHFAAQNLVLEASWGTFNTVLANAPVILLTLDVDGIVTIAEGRDLNALGHARDAMIGRSFFDLYANSLVLVEQARRALAGETLTGSATVGDITIDVRWLPLRDNHARIIGVIAVAIDITERHDAERALKHQEFHDGLTGLPNRVYLGRRLAEALNNAEKHHENVVLALVNLDSFKDINDTLGHHVGDAVLTEAAARIKLTLRGEGIAARLGGDEYAVLLTDAGVIEATALGKRLVTALGVPHVGGDEGYVQISGSVGLAIYPADGTDSATLLRHADVAMESAKRRRSGFAMYDAFEDRHSTARLKLEGDLRNAIPGNDLRLYYQPQARAVSGEITRVEALVRWEHPEFGLLPPDDFIPLAEETGLIEPLTHWVLDEAIRQIKTWDRAGISLDVSVNLSMRTFQDPTFPGIVSTRLMYYGVNPARLTLEVTETVVMADPEQTKQTFALLAAQGIGLSIDDFGTGYSSLSYLRQLPVTELKIDKSFVFAMASGVNKDREIVRLVCDLGHAFNLRVVAEGVETSELWDALQHIGCDYIQGYYLSRPIPAENLATWLGVRHSQVPRVRLPQTTGERSA